MYSWILSIKYLSCFKQKTLLAKFKTNTRGYLDACICICYLKWHWMVKWQRHKSQISKDACKNMWNSKAGSLLKSLRTACTHLLSKCCSSSCLSLLRHRTVYSLLANKNLFSLPFQTPLMQVFLLQPAGYHVTLNWIS